MINVNGNCIVTIKDSVGDGAVLSSGTIASVSNGGTLKIHNGVFTSTGDVAIWAGGKNNNGNVIVEGGTITGQEFAVGVGQNSTLVVEGGKLIANDNAVVGGNGSAGYENAMITINGGHLEGHIQTNGYTGCGIYMPNSGTVNVNGGNFTIDGVGICARAGQINITGGDFVSTVDTEGWVGDKKTQISANGVFYDGAAKYPGLDETASIYIEGGSFVNTADAAIAGVKITQPDNGIEIQSDIAEDWTIAE